MKKAALHNLGCKVNSYELDAIKDQLVSKGYTIVPFEDEADIYVINTCSVTNIADRKSRQMLHKAKKQNPGSVVVAIGCYVQTATEKALKAEGIDLCIGNNNKGHFVEILEEYLQNETSGNDKADNIKIQDLSGVSEYDDMTMESTSGHTRAFVKIQDGCNQFCTYCIIPFARGRVRSRSQEKVLSEIKGLVQAGFKEFVITGIHLSSYGTDFIYDDVKADRFRPDFLLELLSKIDAMPGVERIRLGSLEPRIITEEFTSKLARLPKLCPHFHLSLQSGCNKTLKAMNRHYTAEEFLEKCGILRKHFEHPAITTDVIVGFPGESETDFEECKGFLEKVHFFEMHIFKYSRRKGTVADRMSGQHTDAVKSVRSNLLSQVEAKDSAEFRSYYVGKRVKVLFEEQKMMNGKLYWIGHTPEYVKVLLEAKEDLTNAIRSINVRAMDGEYLIGDSIEVM